MRNFLSSKILLSLFLFLGIGVIIFPAQQTKAEEEYTDCGESTSDIYEELLTSGDELEEEQLNKAEENKAFSCLGEHILDGCKKAKARFSSEEAGEVIFSIEGKNEEGLCKLGNKYGDKEQISSESTKKYANTYAEYPINVEELKKDAQDDVENVEEYPSTLALSAYFFMSMACAFGDEACTGSYTEIGGDFLPVEEDSKEQKEAKEENGSKVKNIHSTKKWEKLKGKILLKVEDQGQAYYVDPGDQSMHSLGKPEDAFSVMRSRGVGVTDKDLSQILPAIDNLTGEDKDDDGLPDAFEDAVGTDPNDPDTDGDGYNDKQELENGYNPQGEGKMDIDENFADKQKGRILLQVEGKGEAWYVNPEDNKRYFLGKPGDAFQVMRDLGLGVSNKDFKELSNKDNNNKEEEKEEVSIGDCQVGQEIGGGIIASCDEQGQPEVIAMKEDISKGIQWGCAGEGLGADSETDGEYNTEQILNNCKEEEVAARLCAESTEGGHDDWYLPSESKWFEVGEDVPLYDNLYKNDMGNFSVNEFYWTSTEGTSIRVKAYELQENGIMGTLKDKDSSFRVRCIRNY
jgi:hypothetical protein